jgi:hypothetical protein
MGSCSNGSEQLGCAIEERGESQGKEIVKREGKEKKWEGKRKKKTDRFPAALSHG